MTTRRGGRLRYVLSALVVFLIAFGLVEVAIFASFSLAVSIGQLLLVGILTLAGSQNIHALRNGFRRELIHFAAIREVDEALAQANYELAVGALMEWNQTIGHELVMQEAHPWSPFTFWKLPPSVREDWK